VKRLSGGLIPVAARRAERLALLFALLLAMDLAVVLPVNIRRDDLLGAVTMVTVVTRHGIGFDLARILDQSI
jgi:hypothetical protein